MNYKIGTKFHDKQICGEITKYENNTYVIKWNFHDGLVCNEIKYNEKELNYILEDLNFNKWTITPPNIIFDDELFKL